MVAYEPSVVWSAIELHDTAMNLPRIHDVLTFHVSQEHARALAGLLRQIGGNVEDLAKASEDPDGHECAWAQAAGRLVLQLHGLMTSANPDPAVRGSLSVDQSSAWAIVPLLELATVPATERPVTPREMSHRLLQTQRD